MNETTHLQEFEPAKGVPEPIKVISVLSIIGCVFGYIGSLTFPFYGKLIDFIEKASGGQGDPSQIDAMQSIADNWVLWMVFSLITTTLCLVGVLMMRKRKAQGLPIYLVGELLPIPFSLIMTGVASLKEGGIIGFVLPIIFSVLYYINRKHYDAPAS